MKLPGQEEFDVSRSHDNGAVEEQVEGAGPRLDGPSDTGCKEVGEPRNPLLFIQLNVLLDRPQAPEWRQIGRWTVFEEKLEVGADRWSAPHVPTVTLPALRKLRGELAGGLVLLDCPAQSLQELMEQVSKVEWLNPEQRALLQVLLLQRPRHGGHTSGARCCPGFACSGESPGNEEAPQKEQCHSPLLQKLPPRTEAGAVLVGELDFLARPLAAFVRLQNSVVLGALVEVPIPCRFLWLLLCPHKQGWSCHEMGRAAAVLLSDVQFQRSVRRASSLCDLLAALDAFLEEVTVLPPGRWDSTARLPPPKCLHKRHHCLAADEPGQRPHSEELQRTGRFFGGLVQDVRRKAPWYPSDFLDALHPQCLSTVLYIYLATVTNAITFGGLLGEATGDAQGVLESFLGTAVAGAAFCLLAGQPLTILSSTGPVLVFERLLFSFSRDYGLDYLPFRLWVGIWVATFCLALVATEASVLVRYFTRFTEEGFCILISLIFIYDAVGKMLSLAQAYPIQISGSLTYGCLCQWPEPGGNESQWTKSRPEERDDMDLGLVNVSLMPASECTQRGGHPRGSSCHTVPDIAFFSLLLFLTTFLSTTVLQRMRSSHFFPSKVRKVLGDFSSILAILLGCGLDAFLGLATPKLLVPQEFKPTLPGRSWLVSPFGANPWWLSVVAVLPALLLSILIFMDQQITAVILNRSEYQLQKGAGFHLDLFCVAVLLLLMSILGLPWYVSTTVISLAHMDSLRRESRACAPGEPHRFLGIREQRLTGLVVFILTGISIFLAPVLKFIPMPVLYGIFLYMGVAAMSSIQFTKRVLLLLMPAKHQPDLLLLRHVPLRRVHLFTAIQLACLAVLWIVKSTSAAIIFPLMLLGLVGVRKALKWVFSVQELLWLDELLLEERSIQKGPAQNSLRGSDSEEFTFVPVLQSELMYQPKTLEIKISVN